MKKIISIIIAAALAAAILPVFTFAEDDFTPPHEHEWEFVEKVDYTCTDDGYDLYRCKTCGEEEKRNITEASHRNEVVSEKEATCGADGEIKYVCSVCGKETVVTYPALGHEWSEGETEKKPTFFTAGRIKFVCKRDSSHIGYEPIPSELSSDQNSATEFFLIIAAVVLSAIIAAGAVSFRKIALKTRPE